VNYTLHLPIYLILLDLVEGDYPFQFGIESISEDFVRVVGISIEEWGRLGVDVGMFLVDLGFEAVYSGGRVSANIAPTINTSLSGLHILFLEVAVCDVVVAPIGHGIELQAVGELHLVGLAKLLKLLPSLPFPLVPVRSRSCPLCATL
jgi:hypothetical protein